MSTSVFIRAHDAAPAEKAGALVGRIRALREGADHEQVFSVDPEQFSAVPGSPFAYWVSDAIRDIFRRFPPLEGNAGTVRVGLQTSDDFRFVRAWWEVAPERIGYSPEDTLTGRGWVHFAKGGSYSPYYADVHLVVNWWGKGAEIKNFFGPNRRLASRPQNEEFYFRPGLTWPRRTTSGLSVRTLPVGSVFSDKGPTLFAEQDALLALIGTQAILQSSLATALIATMLPAATAAARSYEVGIVQKLPVPQSAPAQTWADHAARAIDLQRQRDLTDDTSHCFQTPSLTLVSTTVVIREGAAKLAEAEVQRLERLGHLQRDLDERVFDLYGLPESERERIRAEVYGTGPSPAASTGGEDEASSDRDAENASADEDDEDAAVPEDLPTRVANLLMWCVGVAFGRWDVRMARDPSLIPALQGPFERLPRLAPAALVGPDGLAATRDRIASEAWLRARPSVIELPQEGSYEGPGWITAEEYPVQVAWDGVLVDDPGHPKDIVERVREVLRYVWGDRAEEIEEEALEILRGEGGRSPTSLREWLRGQKASALGKSFFEFHIQRYSKSRRKAPIYWQLVSRTGTRQPAYSVWLYYHRLSDDTLWSVVREYVGPKRGLEESRLEELLERAQGAEGAEKRRLEKEAERVAEVVEDLRAFEDKLRRVAERGYAPDLDDGVVINLAPLHEVVAWAEPGKVWRKLERGEYDWAKLAMRYWPDRVREKCKTDKSLAIAHNIQP